MRFVRALLVVLLAAVAAAADDDDARRAALERAQPLVARALAALRAGEDATELLARARAEVPGDPVVLYDHGVALAAAGRADEAREAYRDVLRQDDAGTGEVAARTRHNLAGSHLAAARDAASLLRTPGALEDAVRAAGSPGGEPLTPATVTMLAAQLREQAVADGLRDARTAVEMLRDVVRGRPAERDAVRNLILAQRARRFLEEEQRRQAEEQSEQQEGEEGEEGDDQEGDQGGQGGDGAQGDDAQSRADADDAARPEDEQEQGRDDRSAEEDDGSDTDQASPPRDLGREAAERLLQQLLDAAVQRARQVEQMRAESLRRGAVERDW